MAIQLKNSIFLHIPKTGGLKISEMLINHVSGTKYIGDKIYDAHLIPERVDCGFFCFVRRPAHFVHSLWHHRARKKKFGHKWNWQKQYPLETQCKSQDYETFMTNITSRPNIVWEHYSLFIRSKKMVVGRLENLSEDLITILEFYNEDYNKFRIMKEARSVKHKGHYVKPVSQRWIEAIELSEKRLMEDFYS